MNNFEKITQMSIDEMALFLVEIIGSTCSLCPHQEKPIGYCDDVDCDQEHIQGIKQYLLQEAEQ